MCSYVKSKAFVTMCALYPRPNSSRLKWLLLFRHLATAQQFPLIRPLGNKGKAFGFDASLNAWTVVYPKTRLYPLLHQWCINLKQWCITLEGFLLFVYKENKKKLRELLNVFARPPFCRRYNPRLSQPVDGTHPCTPAEMQQMFPRTSIWSSRSFSLFPNFFPSVYSFPSWINKSKPILTRIWSDKVSCLHERVCCDGGGVRVCLHMTGVHLISFSLCMLSAWTLQIKQATFGRCQKGWKVMIDWIQNLWIHKPKFVNIPVGQIFL